MLLRLGNINRRHSAAAVHHATTDGAIMLEKAFGRELAAAGIAPRLSAGSAASRRYRRGSTDISSFACSKTSQLMPAAGATFARLVREPCKDGEGRPMPV